MKNSIRSSDLDEKSRYADISAYERNSLTIYDLINAENARARAITAAIDAGSEEPKKEKDKIVSPIARVNHLLREANFPFEIMIDIDETLKVTRDDGATYDIAQLSDGERNAFMLAVNALTAPKGTLLIIDEPERHLHPSITVPFLSAMFAERKDCSFVISTYEIELPIANPEAQMLTIQSCKWGNRLPTEWEVKDPDDYTDFPEELKRVILGDRRKVLFVEGTMRSLDERLYSILFPRLDIEPVGSCDEVERFVGVMRNTPGDLHYIEAFGLIDRDGRPESEIKRLRGKHVYVMQVYSVESLYYCSEAIEAVAQQQAQALGCKMDVMLEEVKQRAYAVLSESGVPERMAKKMAKLRSKCQSRRSGFLDSNDIEVDEKQGSTDKNCDIIYHEELECFNKLISNRKLDDLIARYPLRGSSLFNDIATILRCRGVGDYEAMVRSRVRADPNLAKKLKQHIGSFNGEL